MSMQNDYEGIKRHWPDYEIVGELGSGGYGKVYEIRKNYMGHIACSAVKIIHIPRDRQSANELRSLGMTEENITSYYEKQVTAFQNENLMMEKLKSASNIVTIEDSKVEKNANGIGYTIYIKMELLTSMDYLLMNHMLNPDDIATIANDVCAALIACEQLNIVHRDIKPANIFINEFGTFKLGDFGVARQMQNERTNMTQIGTSQYMAPELYSGIKADKRVDIYSLGIMLYRLANYGCFPFVTPAEISPEKNQEALAKRLSGIPIPLPPQVDEELGRIIVKACANDPKQRYQSARELKKDINRWQAIQEYQLEQNTNKEQKAEVKQKPIAEAKIEPKQKSVAEAKIELKQEPKAEPVAEPKTEAKQEPVAGPKTEAKQEPKAEVQQVPKPEAKQASKTEPKEETGTELKQELPEKKTEKKSGSPPIIAIAAAVLIIGAVGVFLASGSDKADSTEEDQMQVESYDDDHEEPVDEEEPEYANDTQAPVISGLNSEIEVKCGTTFNVKNYVEKNISISDNVTEDIEEYTIECSDNAYDDVTGELSSGERKEVVVNITANDEADNTGEFSIVFTIEPIHVTKDNPNPVIYDGEYGIIKLEYFTYGQFDDFKGYMFDFDMDNKTDRNMEVYLASDSTINNHEVNAHVYNTVPIPANNTGTMISYISEEDIPEDIGEYDSIDGFVGFSYAGEDTIDYVEVIFDIDALQ